MLVGYVNVNIEQYPFVAIYCLLTRSGGGGCFEGREEEEIHKGAHQRTQRPL